MIGLDTSAIIDLFKKDMSLIKFLESTDDKVTLNQISYLELMFGLDFENKKHLSEEEYYDSLFANSLVLELNNSSCKMAGKILMRLKKIGKMIEQSDCAIAGIYLSNGVNKILTKNAKHFENIKKLKVITY